MLNRRSKALRCTIVLGFVASAVALAPASTAKVRVGFNVNIALPSNVHLSVGNYEPYYVGRVFYQPLGVWRPVYSFPVETPYGVVYEPYVYDGARVVCHDYIPGREAGYGELVIEGRGRYDPQWRRSPRANSHDGYAERARYDRRRADGWDARDRDRDRSWVRSTRDRDDDRDRDRNRP